VYIYIYIYIWSMEFVYIHESFLDYLTRLLEEFVLQGHFFDTHTLEKKETGMYTQDHLIAHAELDIKLCLCNQVVLCIYTCFFFLEFERFFFSSVRRTT